MRDDWRFFSVLPSALCELGMLPANSRSQFASEAGCCGVLMRFAIGSRQVPLIANPGMPVKELPRTAGVDAFNLPPSEQLYVVLPTMRGET